MSAKTAFGGNEAVFKKFLKVFNKKENNCQKTQISAPIYA